MKKIITKIGSIVTMGIVFLGTHITALAAAPTKETQSILDNVIPKVDDLGGVVTTEETQAIEALPTHEITEIMTGIIKNILALTMVLAVIGIVVSGIFFLTAEGDEEKTKKAKDILFKMLIGLGIMAAAYGIISGIIQFEFISE